jgi:hypothetical protein
MRADLFIPRLPDNFNLFLMGDSQWGNVGVHEKGLDRAFDMVNSEYRGCKANYVCWMGDSIDAITVNDKRFAFDTTLPKLSFLRNQIDHSISRLKAIKKQLVVVLKGNHEHKWVSIYGDIGAEIARALGCEYGQYVCIPHLLRRKDGALIARLFLHHGFGVLRSAAKDSVQATANMRAALKNKLQHLFAGAALMAMGHTHHLLIVPPDDGLQLVTDGGEVQQVYPHTDGVAIVNQAARIIPPESRWYVNTGSFLRLYSPDSTGYAEMKGMRPVELGFAVATIRDCRINKVYKEVV